MNTTPDYVAVARSFGLTNATYPLQEAFAHLGVKRSSGYALVNSGQIRAIRISERRVVVPAVDIAKVLYERGHVRRQTSPRPSVPSVSGSEELTV